jgi:hypothetical protein
MLTEKAAETIIRICPMRDWPCPHGMSCPYVGDGAYGYPCKDGYKTPSGRAALEEKQG